jgi:hypothetical protein
MSPNWDHVTRTVVLHAIKEYDRLRPEAFFAAPGFAPLPAQDDPQHGL